MRAFIIISLIAIVCAEKFGYNYQAEHSNGDLSFQSGNNIGSGDLDAGSSFDAPVDFEKEFFTFSAPENEFDDPSASEKIAASVRQSLRVIFIKGPENKALENAALALAKKSAEQKTAIYVLNRQTDIVDLANKFNAVSNKGNSQPEVHFVKYRTSEDAANAQRAIQSQYNSLGGSSKSHDGNVAPVLSFASQSSARIATANAPSNSYLPTSVLSRRY